jgi:hypothetical protein
MLGKIDYNTRGQEIYEMDRSVFEKYAKRLIAPSIEERPWDCDYVFSALEGYLFEPEKHDTLLALMVGRVHLIDGIISIDSRLSKLVRQFVSILSSIPVGVEKTLVAAWCYNLINALFVMAGNRSGIKIWVRNQQLLTDKAFMDGLPVLAKLQPKIEDYCALLSHLINELQEGE